MLGVDGSTAYLAVVVQTVVLGPGRVPGQHGRVSVAVPGIRSVAHSVAHEHAEALVPVILTIVPLQRVCSTGE